MDGISDQHFEHGESVRVVISGWTGQVIGFRAFGFNNPEYEVRLFVGGALFKEWFSACELELMTPLDGDGAESHGNIINLAEERAKRAAANIEEGVA